MRDFRGRAVGSIFMYEKRATRKKPLFWQGQKDSKKKLRKNWCEFVAIYLYFQE